MPVIVYHSPTVIYIFENFRFKNERSIIPHGLCGATLSIQIPMTKYLLY
jgi:hypothetical protein